MPPDHTLEQWLPTLQGLARKLARRRGLDDVQIEDFIGELHLKMVADSYRVVRLFDERSTLATYLHVVVARALVDFCNAEWGRWRPSAAARRAGPLAVELERLRDRDGLSTREAAQSLLASGAGSAQNVQEALDALAPGSGPPRPVQLEQVADPARDPESAADLDQLRGLLAGALRRVLADLPAEDRLILRLRYCEGLVVRDIAERLHLPARPLFRTLERILVSLRQALEDLGVSAASALDVLGADPPFCAIEWVEIDPPAAVSENTVASPDPVHD